MEQRKQRVPYWDNIKLILIFLVVLGHCLYSRDDLRLVRILTLGIYSFHMQAFAFVSGYFSKSEHARSKESLVRLGMAYLVFNGLFVIYAALRGQEVLLTHPYYSFWYLLALILWRLAAKPVSRFRFAFPASIALALVVGFWQDAGNAFAFGRAVAFFPFFLAGYLMPRDIGERFARISAKRRVAIGGIACIVAAAAVFGGYFALHYGSADVLMDPYGGMRALITRAGLFVIASIVIVALLLATPNVQIPFLTSVGKNSLAVYILHRYFVLVYDRVLASRLGTWPLVAASVLASLVLLALLGNDFVARLLDSFLDEWRDFVLRVKSKGIVGVVWRVLGVAVVALAAIMPIYAFRKQDAAANTVSYTTYPRLSVDQEAEQDRAFTILFAGDLTLLEDQVKNARMEGGGYDFSPMFQYTAPYIQEADLAIGVLEGPMAGADRGYSTGNYDDGKTFVLNFPDEFAGAIRDAGFDLVTCADNHLLDKGEMGALRTMGVLDNAGLDRTGSYRTAEDKAANRVKMIEKEGLKIAVLSYTYGVNQDAYTDYPYSVFLGGEYDHLTSIIADPNSQAFAETRARVEEDFALAKEKGADIIVVLPHWGTQFAYSPDEFQTTWRKIFLDLGADVILGAHAHTTQPVVMEKVGGKQTFTAYCPGNYTNIYRGSDTDAASLVEVHIDKGTKSVVGGAVIPMWTQSAIGGNYRPLPIYDILNNEELKTQITTYDLERVEEVNKIISGSMFGSALELSMVRPRYEITPQGFRRSIATRVELTDELREGTLYKLFQDVHDVCFVGDSITDGTVNGGYGWYEPIEYLVRGESSNISRGGATSATLLEWVDQIAAKNADLYVVAIGCNDVRFQDPGSAEAYIENLQQLVDGVKSTNSKAHFAFVAPWTTTDGDPGSVLGYEDRLAAFDEYAEALRDFCSRTGSVFINPNPYIQAALDVAPRSDYMLDAVHPNSTTGLTLYAESVLKG